ncbi:hypothetical protein C8J56DRAFT_793156, partial [Mycena floridula]
SRYRYNSGRVIYRVHTPHKLGARTSTITRAIDDTAEPSEIISDQEMIPDTGIRQGRFGHLAQIDWKIIKFAKIRYGGIEYDTKQFFRKVKFGWYGRHRAFTAPDGKNYRWILGARVPTLVTDDKSETLIATFHRKRWLFGKRQAYLEIFPEGMHLADVILVTFIYIEKIRRDKERAASRNGGALPVNC